MGIKQLLLVLDAPGATYRPGDLVTGRLVVTADEENKVKEIYVKLKGTSEVSWSETTTHRVGNRTQTETRVYRACEIYADQHITLLGTPAHQELVLPPGEHVYPFRAVLPVGIPPSFEGVYGNVRYRVKGKVDRPWRLDNVAVTHVTVLGDLDLNLLPALRQPARMVTEKTLCCCWCRSGPLTLVVHVPCTGLLPALSVDVTAEVDNATNSRVDRVVCQLSQKVEFRAQNRIKCTYAEMTSVEFGSVDPRKSATWTRALPLPLQLPPTGLPHCNIIGVYYCLSVTAKVSGPHISPSVEIPVVVGNLPFREPVFVGAPSAPPILQPPPPPSYEESVQEIGFRPPSQSENLAT